jgi:hypothetical protein
VLKVAGKIEILLEFLQEVNIALHKNELIS